MIKPLFIFLFALFFSIHSEAQIYSRLYSGKQEMFLEAESYHLFEEYKEALPLYLELLKDQPGNSFLNYRTGTCYLNMTGQKDNAIEFLEKAIEDIDTRNRKPTYRTTKAPADALFYLGNAYHINYQFDKALETYYRFKEEMDPLVYDIEVIEEYIKASKNAKESIMNPLFFNEENLGEKINSRFPEINPAVSGDEKMMVFTRKLPFYDALFFSEKTDKGQWSWPVEITAELGSDGDCYPASLSWDGSELYLYKSDDLVGNIYLSRFHDGKWTMIEKLNDNINTNYWESHACISSDGNTLYFTSNRPGGQGELDIYFSNRDSSGEWGRAVNIGPQINTPYNENTPFISENDSILYFSSFGHHNIGGYDVFSSSRLGNGNWSKPENAGYGINTPDDDIFYNQLMNGNFAYFSKSGNEGFGEADIYRYEIFSESNPRKFLVKGRMERTDGLQTSTDARVYLVEQVSGDTIHTIRPGQEAGDYEIMIEAGEWQMIFSEKGYDDVFNKIKLRPDSKDDEINVDVAMTGRRSGYEYAPLPGDNIFTFRYSGTKEEAPKDDALFELLPEDLDDTITVSTSNIGKESPGKKDTAFKASDKIAEPEEIVKAEETENAEKEGKNAKEKEKMDADEGIEIEEESSAKERDNPLFWILILAIILLAVFYFKKRNNRNNKKSV
ncbi:MAG: hypothetical protein ACLFQA_02400 [Bacteroidales bacterium]